MRDHAIRDFNLSSTDVEGHNWDDMGNSIYGYLSHCPPALRSSALDNIRGLNNDIVEEAINIVPEMIDLGLTDEQVYAHRFDSWRHYFIERKIAVGMPLERAFETLQAVMMYNNATISYLTDCPETIPYERALRNIEGRNEEEIDELTAQASLGISQLGLTAEQVYAHRFDEAHYNYVEARIRRGMDSDEAFDALQAVREYSDAAIQYLVRCPESIDDKRALRNLDGRNETEIRRIVDNTSFGIQLLELTAEEVYAHRFDEAHYNYVRTRIRRGMAPSEAFEVLQEVRGHSDAAIWYLVRCPGNISDERALENIRGLGESEIHRVNSRIGLGPHRALPLGQVHRPQNERLPLHQAYQRRFDSPDFKIHIQAEMNGRSVTEELEATRQYTDAQLEYLLHRPELVSADHALQNLQGLTNDEIDKVMDATRNALAKGTLPRIQVYADRLFPENLQTIQNGIMPEVAIPRATSYVRAVSDFITRAVAWPVVNIGALTQSESAIINRLPRDIERYNIPLRGFLGPNDIESLSSLGMTRDADIHQNTIEQATQTSRNLQNRPTNDILQNAANFRHAENLGRVVTDSLRQQAARGT